MSGTVSPVGSAVVPKADTATNSKLDKEAFLKLLVAQISNQDPLKPMEGTEFVTQLSQFSAVEQAIQQTQRLDMLSSQLGGLANGEAASLVGKHVSLRGKAIAFDGTSATTANATLTGPAAKVKAIVRDEQGEVVRTIDLGSSPGGALAIKWDGRTDTGEVAKPGSYRFEVRAEDGDGAVIAVKDDVNGVVTKVSFEKGYAELVLDSGAVAPISDLVTVGM